MWRGPTDTPQVRRKIEALHHDDGNKFHSALRRLCKSRGADVFRPSSLYFVRQSNQTRPFMAAPGTFITYPRTSGLDKKKYDVSALHSNVVHEDNLFDVYLGESIAPYVTLPPLTAALPVDKASLTLPLDHNGCLANPKSGAVKHDAYEVDTGTTRPSYENALEHDVIPLGRQQRQERQKVVVSASQLSQHID